MTDTGNSSASFWNVLKSCLGSSLRVWQAQSLCTLSTQTDLCPSKFATPKRPPTGNPILPIIRIVTPGYFRTLGASILQGRDFNDHDTDAAPAVIVNEHMARHYWPRGDAVGKQISVSTGQWLPIVGVVSDIRHVALDKEPVDEAYGSFWESRQGAS